MQEEEAEAEEVLFKANAVDEEDSEREEEEEEEEEEEGFFGRRGAEATVLFEANQLAMIEVHSERDRATTDGVKVVY